jgi:hypothetical protein
MTRLRLRKALEGVRRPLRWNPFNGGSASAMLEPVPAVLIVTSRNRLWQRYGPDGVEAVERAVADLVDAMAERQLAGTPVYTDDSPLLTNFGILPADPGQPSSVARVLSELGERCGWLDEIPRYVLILGDDGVVPFHRTENPSPDADNHVLTDHLYAVRPAAPMRPAFAVGRIPDGSLAQLTGAILNAANAHRRLAKGKAPELPATAFGYSASIWKRAARAVYGAIGDPKQVRLSPPLTRSEAPAPGASGPRYRYYNLHGLSDSADWFGQRDPTFPADYPFFPVALRPEDVATAPGSLVFSEACYGADIDGRATHDSIALTSLAKGALGFVGATGVAYGGLDGPLVAADLLAHRFWTAILEGLPAGRALSRAKWELASEAHARQGYLDAEDEKAVHNFVLYGDPSLVHSVPSVWAEDAAWEAQASDDVEWAGPAAKVGTLPVQPQLYSSYNGGEPNDAPAGSAPNGGALAGSLVGGNGAATAMKTGGAVGPRQVPGALSGQRITGASATADLVAYVKKTVAGRLPEFGGADVKVTTGRSRRCLHAKSDDGGTGTEGGALVVTLTKALPMCTGQTCREVVRVTVGPDGRIRRVTVSR